jgi:hypothetical protein
MEKKTLENTTNSKTSSHESDKQYFGGKVHKLTQNDRSKGGKTMTPKRYLANAFNSMKTGKYSNKIPHCHTCILKDRCSAYDPKDPKAACKVIDIPNYYHLMTALTFKNEEDFDDFLNKQIQRMYLKNLTSDDWAKLKDFVLLLLKLKETKYKSPQEQTVNIQINNFQNEFTVFKDVTIKILKKHPDVMLEWRDALESAKRSN